jgi:hypothetical protein
MNRSNSCSTSGASDDHVRAQAVVEVLSERATVQRLAEIPICRGDDLAEKLSLDGLSYRVEGANLEHTQELHLDRRI